MEHWRVAEDGALVDTYSRLTKVFECPDYFFFNRLAGVHLCGHSYYEKNGYNWKKCLIGIFSYRFLTFM